MPTGSLGYTGSSPLSARYARDARQDSFARRRDDNGSAVPIGRLTWRMHPWWADSRAVIMRV
jgi:hypothetical protein